MTDPVAHGHPGVNLIGFASSVIGLGVFTRMLADLLIREGIPLRILSVTLPNVPDAPEEDIAPYRPYFSGAPAHGINLFVFGGDWANGLLPQLRGPTQMATRYNALVPFWELNEYPDDFIALRESVHLFLAPTRFIQHGLLQQVEGAHVDYLPCAALTAPATRTRREGRGRPFRFFFNFDLMSSVDRKQPGLLIGAFAELFGADPSTELVLKVSGTASAVHAATLKNLQGMAKRLPGLKLITERLPRPQMLALIGGADAYVSCHRAEGLGLGLLEAMAMGVPCVATGYGGNTDFMNRDNAIIVRHTMEDVACPIYRKALAGKPARWARPDPQDLRRAMLAVRTDAALRDRLSSNGKRDALKYILASWSCGLGSLLHAASRQFGHR